MGKWLPLVIGVVLIAGLVLMAKRSKTNPPTAGASGATSATGTPSPTLQLVPLKGGPFTMGTEEGDGDEGPAHTVVLKPFLIDACEVTQELYEGITRLNPSKHKDPKKPVDSIAWSAAAEFCNLRSKKDGFTPCYDESTWACNFAADGYRLPTEAEWEYACRAGTNTKYSFGTDANALKDYAWYDPNSGNDTHPVGLKKPNAWGLYDTTGNVCEWVNDYYSDSYYAKSPKEDPVGSPDGYRLTRGGSFQDTDTNCRVTYRKYNDDPEKTQCGRYDMIGFRCVRRAKDSTVNTIESPKAAGVPANTAK